MSFFQVTRTTHKSVQFRIEAADAAEAIVKSTNLKDSEGRVMQDQNIPSAQLDGDQRPETAVAAV